MQHYQCDICRASVERDKLYVLNKQYKQDDVEEVCQGCLDELNKAIISFEAYLANVRKSWVRRLINVLKEKFIRQGNEGGNQ